MTSRSDYGNDFLASLKGGLIWVALITGIVGFSWQSYRLWRSNSAMEDLQKDFKRQMQSFHSELGRSETRLAAKQSTLNNLVKQIPLDIRKDMETWKAEIKSFNKFTLEHRTAKTSGRVSSNRPPLRARPLKSPEKPEETSIFSLEDDIKVCNWGYSDWRLSAGYEGGCKEGTFSYKLDQSFEGILVEGDSKSGAPSYVRVWEVGANGERLKPPLFVKEFSSIKRLKGTEKLQLLAPHLDVGLSLQTGSKTDLFSTVGISVGGYGATKDDLTWRFIRGGVEMSRDGAGVSFCPVLYNVGKPLPLVSNIWVAPCYGHKDKGSFLLQITGVL